MAAYRTRHLEHVIQAALADTRVVIVNGARQVGKSTTVHRLTAGQAGVVERRLDLTNELSFARLDPESFVDHDGLLVIDEIQRAPELILPIKARVDVNPRPGQFLLTGSARLLGLRALPDALVGRAETVEMWPLSQGEIDGKPDRFIDSVFQPEPMLATAASLSRADYIERALRGGFPESIDREGARRARFFEGYVQDLINRDVTQLGEIQRRDVLTRLVAVLADRSATTLSVDAVASSIGVARNTLERYVALFEEVFLIKRVPAWSNSATARATRSRKLVFVDSGVSAHLAGITRHRLDREPTRAGALIETFVIGELHRQVGWSNEFVRMYHYRTKDGDEVDAVVEHHDGRMVGIEVKASSSVSLDDARHLNHLRRLAGDQFHLGVLLYTGTRIQSLGDRLIAAPIDSVWHSSPGGG